MSEKKDLLVSVIIPVYKVEEYLDKCIESVVNQTYKNLEIILVDDGSPDNCPKMCDDWAKKDKRIKVIHKENGGVSSARNAGIEIASGDFITFLDSDDYFSSDFSDAIKYIVDTDYVCFGYNILIENSCKQINPFNSNKEIAKPIEEINLIPSGMYNAIWNKFYRANIIKDNNLRFDTELVIAEDWKFNFDYYMLVQKLTCVNLAYYNYYQNPQSVMKNISYNKIENTLQVCEYAVSKIDIIDAKTQKIFLKKIISQNLLSVLYRANQYSKDQNRELKNRLKKLKKYICYGDSLIKKLIVFCVKIFGIKFTTNILALK